MPDYMLTIKISMEKIDDVDAREKAREIMYSIRIPKELDYDVKLQRIYKDKKPSIVKI